MPKKKETQKEAHRSFIETIRKLREKVRKELDKNKVYYIKKKSKPITAKPIKKKKLKKKNNPHKKSGGY